MLVGALYLEEKGARPLSSASSRCYSFKGRYIIVILCGGERWAVSLTKDLSHLSTTNGITLIGPVS